MARNLSFALTTRQFRDRTKDVTRRMGWVNLKAGDILCGVEKGMGLKKGEQMKRLGLIRVLSAGPEPLRRMIDNPAYGAEECSREGFPNMLPEQFVEFFCGSHKGCTVESAPTRIEFEYLDAGAQPDGQ